MKAFGRISLKTIGSTTRLKNIGAYFLFTELAVINCRWFVRKNGKLLHVNKKIYTLSNNKNMSSLKEVYFYSKFQIKSFAYLIMDISNNNKGMEHIVL